MILYFSFLLSFFSFVTLNHVSIIFLLSDTRRQRLTMSVMIRYKYQFSGELEKQFTDNVIDNKPLS